MYCLSLLRISKKSITCDRLVYSYIVTNELLKFVMHE